MPAAGDNLRLNNLAAATGQATKSLGAAAGTTTPGAIVNFTQFTITGVTTPSINTSTVSFGGTVTASANFSGFGSRFARISSRSANFTFTTPANMSVSGSGASRTYTNNFNPGGTGCSASTTRSVTVTFADGFNLVATNYNTALTTATFTLYSPPSPSVAYSSGTKPATCTTGGGVCAGNNISCYGATITLNGNAGTYNGVAGSSLDYYINGSFVGTRSGNTSTLTTAGVYCTGTSYNTYVINNYTCQSSTVGFTSISYL